MLFASLLFGAVNVVAEQSDGGIAIIVSPTAATVRLNRDEAAQIFKQKKRFWEDGQRIQPVNLPASTPVRRAFSQQVIGQSPEELDDYWKNMYFHGVQPPFVLASEEAVVRFVAGTPGAIGYVSNCIVDHRVRVILRLDAGGVCQH